MKERRSGVLMRFAPSCVVLVSVLAACSAKAAPASTISIDYPEPESVFPSDIIPPTFLWRESNEAVTSWGIEVRFEEHAPRVRLRSAGEKLTVGEIDANIHNFVYPKLNAEQAASHTWKPDPKTWEIIKKHSRQNPATVIITGYRDAKSKEPISVAQVSIRTSVDPVGAPIFYRDVPLIPPKPEDRERGVIKPLPDSVLPLIKWRIRSVSETHSRTVMENLPTCANCHSIARDGKTLGIDVDGPQNDKGLYALVPIEKHTSIRNDYVIRWSSFTEEGAPKRFGFMSQVSPDGKYVITSIDVPGSKTRRRVDDRIYQGFYDDYGFGQVFYPTRGVLAWYSRETGKLQPLPGADDPNYVQTAAFWSPDGKYLVFCKAPAQDPYFPGQKRAEYANDPNERQVQYDLYRIPFNNGQGGKAEKITGASENGLSNNFAKVSPDGRWVVFVQNKSGLLMRPDSKLYIVPFEGGAARPLRSNLKVMNSWHSFSPNGKWLVFSSKTPSPYTRLYLTHIDEQGNSTPAILIENAAAANRAVNIPEFLNEPSDYVAQIDAPATDFYKLFDKAAQLLEKKQYPEAISAWHEAIQLAPDDARAHNNLGVALAASGKPDDAIAEYNRALELNPESSQANNNLGTLLAESGRMDEALLRFEKAVELNPDNSRAQINLGGALAEKGRLAEALEHLRKGADGNPDFADGQNNLGATLARMGAIDEAIPHLEKAVSLAPQSVAYRYNLGRVLAAKGRFQDAAAYVEEASRLSGGREPAILELLAGMYFELGRPAEAMRIAQQALDIATQQHDGRLQQTLREDLGRYAAAGASVGNY